MKHENLTWQEKAQKFSFSKAMGYAMAFGNNILAGYFITFVTYFATNSLFISAAAIGIVMAVSTFTDGITDLIAGYILDRTNTRWGKARPYLLFGILQWVALVLIFCTPQGSQTMKLVWIFIFFILQKSVFQTMYSICMTPLLKRMVVDENARLKTISFQTIAQMLVGMALGMIMPIIIDKAGSNQMIWIATAVILAVIGAIMSIIAFITCKEYTDEQLIELGVMLKQEGKEKGTTVKGMLKSITGNRYVLFFLLIYGIIALVNAIASVSGTYYYSVNVGNLPIMSVTTMLGFLLYPLFAVYPKMVTKIGIRNFVYIVGGLTILGTAIRMVSGTNTIGILIGSLLAGFGGAVNYVFPIIMIKCMDYGQMKLGVSTEGAYAAVQGFLYKVVAAIGSALLGFILTLGHYDGALAVQPASAHTAINFVFNIFPIISYALVLVFINFADPTKKIEEMRAEIAKNGENNI